MWPDDVVRDSEGAELDEFGAAYLHACGLINCVRARFSEANEQWWIEVADGTSGCSIIIAPAMVSRSGSAWRNQRLR